MSEFEPTCDRFIAYFDLMGFKDFVYRNSHDEVKKTVDFVCNIVKTIDSIGLKILNGKTSKAPNSFSEVAVRAVVFSDSVIFISNSNTIHDAREIIFVSGYFLCKLFDKSIPVKGALAYGTFTADFEKSSFFGRPLIDAFLLAEETYFYGAVLHHTFETYWKKIDKSNSTNIGTTKSVPMKGGYITHSHIDIAVYKTLFPDAVSLEVVIEKFYESVSGSTRLYVDNTKKVYSTTLGDRPERMGLIRNK